MFRRRLNEILSRDFLGVVAPPLSDLSLAMYLYSPKSTMQRAQFNAL